MATASDRRTATDGGAGGKMLRRRRPPASSRTPYSRPEKLPESSQASIEDRENPNWLSGIIYPAKMIASGAGKLLSFFGPDSSSSSDDEDGDSSEIDEDEQVDDDASFQGDHSKKVLSSSSKSDKKRAIEQLVMQETFSREEGNELIKLVKSRVVDTNGSIDENAANMCTAAIMEAQNWLQQKRSGSKRKMEDGYDFLATSSQLVTRNEKGSPVDVAKSYMQDRPAWASPSLNCAEFRSPSPVGILNYKEETPNSTFCSSEVKRSSLSSGSWNILEEIRRVRSKAAEELLAATPLTKTHPQDSLMESKRDSTHDERHNLSEASLRLSSRTHQDGDAVEPTKPEEFQQDAELKSNEDDEGNDITETAAENGFPSAVSSLAAGHDASVMNSNPSKEDNENTVNSTQALPDDHFEDPQANPPDYIVNGSQQSSSIEPGESPQEMSQSIEEQTSVAKSPGRGRKPRGGYRRRGRGRGSK